MPEMLRGENEAAISNLINLAFMREVRKSFWQISFVLYYPVGLFHQLGVYNRNKKA